MKHILLVDDDEDMMRLTERWLTKADYTVSTATSGQGALDLLMRDGARPDLILLDYAMPEMDGPETLKAIRAQEGLREIPVLFRTGKEDEDALQLMESLHAGIVSKADGKPGLLAAIKSVL